MKEHQLTAFCKWCQNYPFEKIAQTLKDANFDGGDILCRTGSPIDHANAPALLPEIKKVFDRYSLSLKTLVTGLIEPDAEADRLLGTASSIGVEKVRLGFFNVRPHQKYQECFDTARARLARMEKLLARHGIKGSLQIHSGDYLETNASSTVRLLEVFDPQWLGVQYDPGHLAATGESIRLALDIIGNYLHSVNVKSPRWEYTINPDTGRLQYQVIWVPLKDGMLNVPLLLEELDRVGYKDALNIAAEYRCSFHMVENDVEATTALIAKDVKYVRNLMKDTLTGDKK